MARRTLLIFAATTLCALAVPAAPAVAGGGCHSGVTTGEGDTVEMRDACFTPTTLRVAPGDEVSFVNLDPITHNVGGNLWGHLDDMGEGDAFTATFTDAGIYPYACSYHPGMTGAIVVGDGTGAGNGEAVTIAAFEPPSPSPEVEIRTVEVGASEGGSSGLGWVAGGAIGLAIGLGVGLLLRRRPAATAAVR
ncbi:MAG TPA: plastocyanin/azurin family copper-binding protein [Actinomycetota bacterium]|jgi:plastocyanin